MISLYKKYKNRVEGSRIAQRSINGAVWSIFGTLISSGITLILWMIIARIMGKQSYGELVLIQSTLAMIGIFAGFGIGSAATRYAAELKIRDPERLGHILTLSGRSALIFGIGSAIVLIVCSEWLASNIFKRADLFVPMSIAAGSVFFSAMDAYQKSVLIGVESMRSYAIGAMCGALVSAPVLVLVVYNYSLIGAAAGLVVSSGIQAAISRYQVHKELKKIKVSQNAYGCLKESKVLLHFAFPALLSGAMVVPAHWIVQAILANQPGGYSELAVLGIAMQWFQIILFIPNTTARAVFPVLTDSLASLKNESAKSIIFHSVLTNILMALPIVLFLLFFGGNIYHLYGIFDEERNITLSLAGLAGLISGALGPVGLLLAAHSKMWLGAGMNLVWAVTYILCAKYLISFGANGVLVALCIGYVVHAIWTSIYAYNQLWKIEA